MKRVLTLLAAGALLVGCGGDSGEAGSLFPETLPSLSFTPVAQGIAEPTAIVHAGDGSGRLFLLEQEGRIRVLKDGAVLSTPFLDISDQVVAGGERGLLGLAFPPDFASSGHFYVDYTRASDGATVVSRIPVSADPDVADASAEEQLLTVDQPFSNHNGGQIAFGPDGYLYIGLGDGGSGGDPEGNAQDAGVLLGKVLRIDVEADISPYAIPPDNPFVDDPNGRDEIWATGLRNPWRFSFDRQTGDLYIADVGQSQWEEVNFQTASASGGANYGWNILEGPECYSPDTGCSEPPAYSAPVAFYDHDLGCSVTGGFVYRGPGNPAMQETYFYGDFCSGRLWGLRLSGEVQETRLYVDTSFSISAFGEDEEGRLYLADYASGTIYRIDEQ